MPSLAACGRTDGSRNRGPGNCRRFPAEAAQTDIVRACPRHRDYVSAGRRRAVRGTSECTETSHKQPGLVGRMPGAGPAAGSAYACAKQRAGRQHAVIWSGLLAIKRNSFGNRVSTAGFSCVSVPFAFQPHVRTMARFDLRSGHLQAGLRQKLLRGHCRFGLRSRPRALSRCRSKC